MNQGGDFGLDDCEIPGYIMLKENDQNTQCCPLKKVGHPKEGGSFIDVKKGYRRGESPRQNGGPTRSYFEKPTSGGKERALRQ